MSASARWALGPTTATRAGADAHRLSGSTPSFDIRTTDSWARRRASAWCRGESRSISVGGSSSNASGASRPSSSFCVSARSTARSTNATSSAPVRTRSASGCR